MRGHLGLVLRDWLGFGWQLQKAVREQCRCIMERQILGGQSQPSLATRVLVWIHFSNSKEPSKVFEQKKIIFALLWT